MKQWISSGCALLLTALFPLSASAQQMAVPLGSSGAPYGYYEYLPPGYNSGTDEWPVVVFLHGLGEVGNGTTELPRVLHQGVPRNIHNGAQYPFIAISPQSTVGWWSVADIDAMIEFVKSHYRVDLGRIYLTGLSLGGGGVWDYARTHPEKLAAIAPICGVYITPDGAKLVNVPTWAFHSWGDGVVPADASVAWADAIAGALTSTPPANVMANYPGVFTGPPGPGQTSDRHRTASFDEATGSWTWQDGVPPITNSHPNLTLYQDTSHDSWTRTYNNPVFWDWLLAQDRDPDPAPCNTNSRLITPMTSGAAQGTGYFPMEEAFDAQPTLSPAGEPVGGSGGADAPYLPERVGYIDFGPDWSKVRITSTWTRYRSWSVGDQTPYVELWWDDDTDSLNDSGVNETDINFNTAQGLDTGVTEPWLRDRDLCLSPVAPRARYLLGRTPANMTNRAKEYAILGYIAAGSQLIVPAASGAAQGTGYFPMEEAFDAQPTLSSAGVPVGGSGGATAPYLPERVGYIDFGPDWSMVRITSTWTQYRTWSTGDQTPYVELWWDDDTDTVNDGSSETTLNFNTAQGLNTGTTEPWLRDRDLSSSPAVPRARYLLCRTPANMTNRAKEYAILGYIDP